MAAVDLNIWKTAAIALCKARGVDPLERVYQNDDSGWLCERWVLAAEELHKHSLLTDIINKHGTDY